MAEKKKMKEEGVAVLMRHGVFLLMLLLVVNILGLLAYRFLEMNEQRFDLEQLAGRIPHDETVFNQLNESGISELPGGVLVLKEDGNGDSDDRFKETVINQREYLAYRSDDGYIVATPERSLNRETRLMGYVLLAVYVAQLVLFAGWWLFMRERVREQFIVH